MRNWLKIEKYTRRDLKKALCDDFYKMDAMEDELLTAVQKEISEGNVSYDFYKRSKNSIVEKGSGRLEFYGWDLSFDFEEFDHVDFCKDGENDFGFGKFNFNCHICTHIIIG